MGADETLETSPPGPLSLKGEGEAMSLDATAEPSRPMQRAWEMIRRSSAMRAYRVRSAIWRDGYAEERPKPKLTHGKCCATDAASV